MVSMYKVGHSNQMSRLNWVYSHLKGKLFQKAKLTPGEMPPSTDELLFKNIYEPFHQDENQRFSFNVSIPT